MMMRELSDGQILQPNDMRVMASQGYARNYFRGESAFLGLVGPVYFAFARMT